MIPFFADPGNEGGNLQGNLFHGQQGGKGCGQTHHEGGGPVDDNSVFQRFVGGGGIQFFIDEPAYQIGIDHGNHSGFRRGEFSGIDPSKDDDRRQDGPDGIPEGMDNLAEGGFFRAAPVPSFFGHKVADQHQGHSHQYPRQESGCKKVGDGRPGNHTVDHKGHGRGDDDPYGPGRCRQSGRKGLAVPVFHHLRNHKGPYGRYGGHCRTGNGSKEHADHNGNYSQAPGNVPDETFKKSTSRLAMPPPLMRLPASMKKRG